MNFFENELRKIFENSYTLENPTYVGRACFGDIGEDLRARVEFVIDGTVDHYSALRITVLNRTNGTVDQMKVRLDEILGKQAVSNPNFPHGVSPHIWIYQQPEWYVFKPGPKDYQQMHDCISRYLDVFREKDARKPALDASIARANQKNPSKKDSEKPKERASEPER